MKKSAGYGKKGRVMTIGTSKMQGGHQATKGHGNLPLRVFHHVQKTIKNVTGPPEFLKACEDAGVTPTARQWSKFKRGVGRAAHWVKYGG